MGRELGMHRIDFLKDGTAIIRHSDYNLCGRTEFTGQITDLFYSPEESVCYLLVARDNAPDEDILSTVHKIHVKVEDDYWDEKEFDMEYAFVKRSSIVEICKEQIKKDEKELQREEEMLRDIKIARQHANTVAEFTRFSDFIDELLNFKDNYFEEAKDYLNTYLSIENTIVGHNAHGHVKHTSKEVTESWILLTYSE